MSFLIIFCFISLIDPFCLPFTATGFTLWRLSFRDRHGSLSSFCFRVFVFILFLMLILCLILLPLTVCTLSHKADKRGKTRGKGN